MKLVFVAGFALFQIILDLNASCVKADDWRSLVQPQLIAWSEQPLAAGLQDISEKANVAIWLDRRVDPGIEVTLQAAGPLVEVIQSISESAKVRAVAVDDLIVVARNKDADRIASSVADLRDQSIKLKDSLRLRKRIKFGWPLLATPREICAALAMENKVTIDTNPLPHDLWRPADFIAIDTVTLLALIGGGFDLQPNFSQQPIGWSNLPERIEYTKRYANVREVEQLRKQVLDNDPQAKVRVASKGVLELTATAAGHQWIEIAFAKLVTPKPVATTKPMELEVLNKPARVVIAAVAGAVGWQLDWQAAETSAQKLVTFHLKDASGEAIIEEICRQVPCQWRLDESRLTITDVSAQTTNQ